MNTDFARGTVLHELFKLILHFKPKKKLTPIKKIRCPNVKIGNVSDL